MSPLPARVHQLAEVSVLRDEYTPLAQRALHHLFPGYPLGGLRITPKAIWHMVKAAAKRAGIKDLAPHDLRCTIMPFGGGAIDNRSAPLRSTALKRNESAERRRQRRSERLKDVGLRDIVCRLLLE